MVTLKAVKEGRMLTVEEHFMMKDMHRKGVGICGWASAGGHLQGGSLLRICGYLPAYKFGA
jgi:hypothetical protein